MQQFPLKVSFRSIIVENDVQNLFLDLVLEFVVGFGGNLDESVVVEGFDGCGDVNDILKIFIPAIVEVAGGIENGVFVYELVVVVEVGDVFAHG